MPYIEINGANIYYNAYGEDQPARAPIVLIHGSTIDSHTDWDLVAPELAHHYRVFAPDCRGHGRSNNPCLSYSFKELAEDVASLLRLLPRRVVPRFGNDLHLAAGDVLSHGFGFRDSSKCVFISGDN